MHPAWYGPEGQKRWEEWQDSLNAAWAADRAEIAREFKLPVAWEGTFPPQPVIEVDGRPRWNREWLAGLEAFVRRVVREELGVADQKPDTRDRIPCGAGGRDPLHFSVVETLGNPGTHLIVGAGPSHYSAYRAIPGGMCLLLADATMNACIKACEEYWCQHGGALNMLDAEGE